MILLSGHSLKEVRRIPLESMSLAIKERQSTATIIPADMTGITTDSWMMDDTNPGKGIVWRVKSIQTAYATNTPTVQLEHVINTLRDRILFGETTPATIAGKNAKKCTAEQAVRFILSKQSDWVLGNFGYSVSNNYKFDGDSLFDALVKVTKTLKNAWWSYDLTTYPFKLNIAQQQNGITCELRPGRNLVTITKTIDRTGMYTRFYPIGKDDLHVSGNYVGRNEKTYGVIEKVEVDQSRETEAELRAWADERLTMHAEPSVNIVVDGIELADATGEALDRLNLGRLCRIPLTEFDTVIEERITEMNYRDKVFEPENVKITLANPQEDVTQLLADEIKEGGGQSGRAARGSSRQSKEDHAWIEDTNDHVALCAEGIIGKDAKGNPNWVRLSQLVVDGDGIHSMVKDVQDEVVQHQTAIEQNEKSISLMAEDIDGMSGQISVAAGNIDMVVKNIGQNGKVTAASICLAIEKAGSKATISADHIVLSGNTKLNSVMSVSNKTVSITAPLRVSNNLMVESVTIRDRSSNYTIDGTNIMNTIRKAQVDGNILKMWTYADRGDPSITFSKAVAPPQLSGSWSSGKLTVTSTPTAQASFVRLLGQDNTGIEWAEDYMSATIPVIAQYGSSGQYTESTGWRVYLNTSPAWQAGYDAAPSSSYTGHTMQCTGRQQTYPGSTTYQYTFRLEGNYSFQQGSNYTMYRTSW